MIDFMDRTKEIILHENYSSYINLLYVVKKILNISTLLTGTQGNLILKNSHALTCFSKDNMTSYGPLRHLQKVLKKIKSQKAQMQYKLKFSCCCKFMFHKIRKSNGEWLTL